MADSKVASIEKTSFNLSFKVSRKFWLVLGIGVLVILIATLWYLRNQQVAEQNRLSDDLSMVNSRLAGLELDQLSAQQLQLRDEIAATKTESLDLINKIGIPTDSIAISDTLYAIALKSGVVITNISASEEQTTKLANIPCRSIALETKVTGDWSKLVEFVSDLKSDFTTCLVETMTFTVSDQPLSNPSSVDIKLTVYTFEGKLP